MSCTSSFLFFGDSYCDPYMRPHCFPLLIALTVCLCNRFTIGWISEYNKLFWSKMLGIMPSTRRQGSKTIERLGWTGSFWGVFEIQKTKKGATPQKQQRRRLLSTCSSPLRSLPQIIRTHFSHTFHSIYLIFASLVRSFWSKKLDVHKTRLSLLPFRVPLFKVSPLPWSPVPDHIPLFSSPIPPISVV